MTDAVIRAEGLGKRYRIGARRRSYGTLRESIVSAARRMATAPLRAAARLGCGASEDEFIWALKGVSFEVKRGEVMGVIGRNGAGKTTLLKVLSRITEPTEGRAEIRGRVGSLLEVGTGFHPELTGRENVYLNGAILGMKRREISAKFDEIVSFAEIERFIDTPIKRYSAGMHTRLAFAVAAHLEPEILLVDEVLAVGDAAFQKKCLGKMGEVAGRGRTVLFVSHSMTSILSLCSRAIWLEDGLVGNIGDTRPVVNEYVSVADVPLGVAEFDKEDGSDKAHLIRAYVSDTEGGIRPDVEYEKGFLLVVEFSASDTLASAVLGLKLYSSENSCVLHTATCDWEPLAEYMDIPPGTHRAAVKVPGNLLAPGRYTLGELGIWTRGFGHHHHAKGNLAYFNIMNKGLRTVGDEVLRPRWEWVIEEIRR